MIDRDLADLYQVPTKRLNEQVKRNAARFPPDFMFQLSAQEVGSMNRSQFATGSEKHRSAQYRPYAFTELGVAMLSSVLNSERAIQMNIYIMRAFVKMREVQMASVELSDRVRSIERELKSQGKDINDIIAVVNKLVDIQKYGGLIEPEGDRLE